MRIGLNLLHALPKIGGVWNYIAGLLTALGECDRRNTYVAFVTRTSERLVPPQPNFSIVRVDVRSEVRARRIFYENTLLQRQARQYQLDCMHWFANTQAIFNTVPGVVTVYDLMVFAKPQAFHWVKRLYLQALIPLTAHRARVLLPMSQSTAQDLIRIAKATESKMVVIPPVLGAQFVTSQPAEILKLRTKYHLPDQFWLYVAHFYPHKNHMRLLQAYRRLKSEGFAPWPLVLCGDFKGSDDLIRNTVAELGLERDVKLTLAGSVAAASFPRLEGSELPVLYSAATAQILPSLFEGAGIPALESMACGCPLAASNIPSFREFAGEAALYFDPQDPNAISQAMLTLQQDSALRTRLRTLGLTRLTEFKAKNVVSKLLAAYSRAMQKKQARRDEEQLD